MSERAAHLVDQVLPDAPVRQWVLSLPHRLMLARSKVTSVTASPRRSRTRRGSPHSTGGDTPDGGGGTYDATSENIRPMNISAGQVEKAIVPPGASTRSISPIATAGRGANMWPYWLTTTSDVPSANGSASTSPSCQSIGTFARRAFYV